MHSSEHPHRKLREAGKRFVEDYGRDVDRWIGSAERERAEAGIGLMRLAGLAIRARGGIQALRVPRQSSFPRFSSGKPSRLARPQAPSP